MTHHILFLVLQNSLKESSALMAGGFLIKHACLNDLLINIQFVFGSRKNFLLHTVDSTQAEHTYFILLANAMSSVLSLQVLVVEIIAVCD